VDQHGFHAQLVGNPAGVLAARAPETGERIGGDIMAARRAGEGEREVRAGKWTGWRPTHLLGRSLSGKVLGVPVSTIHQTYAQTYFEAATELRTYQTQDEANQDLAAGRIDATQADSLAMDDFLKTDAGQCCEVKGAVAQDEAILGAGVGAGVRKGDEDLRAALNRGIAAILENGTYDEITGRYFATSIYGN